MGFYTVTNFELIIIDQSRTGRRMNLISSHFLRNYNHSEIAKAVVGDS